jgi:hypothetical protein
MLAMPGLRIFSLTADAGSEGVSCCTNGVFVGGVPLLARKGVGAGSVWSARPFAELNEALSARYRLPVDVSAKAAALELLANAFNRDDYAFAAIVAVQMQFPDPPPLGKCAETNTELQRRALDLYASGVLKADWDPSKHPRTGVPPNRGRFALKPKPPPVPSVKPRTGWPAPKVNTAARKGFAEAASIFAKTGRFLFWGMPVVEGILAFIEAFSPTELNSGEDRLTAQLKAALQAPKTLEELQQEPTENNLGYEQHHIVGQTDDNLAKKALEKFGSEAINYPSNIIWIPRLQHECVSAAYSRNSDGVGSLLVREVINKLDFSQQREAGLKILRDCGTLE